MYNRRMDTPITVLFFGMQGAGKGTQVTMLIDCLKAHTNRGLIHIDMGQELRELRANGSYVSKLIGEYLEAGKRVPDFLPIYLQTRDLIERLTGIEHIIGDGIARGPQQTDAFDTAMTFLKRDNFCIINLVISDEVAIQRMIARGRSDDTEEAIRRRIEWTKTDVFPQLELFKSRNRPVYTIDGEPDPETVHKNILSMLGLSQ